MPSEEDEAGDEELAEIIRDRQVRAARAKGTNVPLLLDPKLILDYIDLWHKDPNTPMPDFKLTPGQSHVLPISSKKKNGNMRRPGRSRKCNIRMRNF